MEKPTNDRDSKPGKNFVAAFGTSFRSKQKSLETIGACRENTDLVL
jgi:hypothetical protein